MAKTISSNSVGIMGSYSQAWSLLVQNKNGVLTVSALVIVGLLLGFFAEMSENELLTTVGGVVQVFLTWLATWGYLQVTRGVKSYSLMTKAQDFIGFLKYIAVSLIIFAMVVIGLILLVVPGIYLALKYGFAPMFIIDKGVGISESLRLSAEMMKDRKFSLLVWCVLYAVINFVGLLLLGLGVLVTVPLTMLASVVLYNSWKK